MKLSRIYVNTIRISDELPFVRFHSIVFSHSLLISRRLGSASKPIISLYSSSILMSFYPLLHSFQD
jgi:hypothetical protein